MLCALRKVSVREDLIEHFNTSEYFIFILTGAFILTWMYEDMVSEAVHEYLYVYYFSYTYIYSYIENLREAITDARSLSLTVYTFIYLSACFIWGINVMEEEE